MAGGSSSILALIYQSTLSHMSKRDFYGMITLIWILKKCGVNVKNVLVMWLMLLSIGGLI